jgi:hypothetical protein
MTPEDKYQLEAIMDRTSLKAVLVAIAEICAEKAAHIRENWQDRVTAQPWATASAIVDKTADTISYKAGFVSREQSRRTPEEPKPYNETWHARDLGRIRP